jgi:hypothetical protein
VSDGAGFRNPVPAVEPVIKVPQRTLCETRRYLDRARTGLRNTARLIGCYEAVPRAGAGGPTQVVSASASLHGLLHFSHANAKESVSIAVSMIGFATFSASSPFANITTPDFLAGSAITKALKTPLSPQCQSMTPLCSR